MDVSSLHRDHPWWSTYLQDPSVRVTNDTNTTGIFHRESVGTVGNNVDMVICCLSLVGCIAIILPYVMNRKSRKLRHILILGLATSDLVTSVCIIIITACLIANVNLVQEDGACTFLGYILVSSIFSQHLWNLSIAIVTYMILVHPLSSFTLTVERRVRWLWPAFWLISFVVNAIPFGFGGFGFRGGYCSLTTSFYFSSIFQFVPRAIVFCVILTLYTHLFFFLRRTNLFSKANNTNSMSQANQSRYRSQNGVQSRQLYTDTLRQPQHHEHPLLDPNNEYADPLATATHEVSPTVKAHTSSGASSAVAHSRKTSSASRILPPVLNKNDPTLSTRRRSSSLGDKDNSVEMDMLSSASRRKGSASGSDAPTAATAAAQNDPALSGLLAYSMKQTTAEPTATYGLLDPNYSMAAPSNRPVPGDLDIERANASHAYDSSSTNAPSPSDSSYAGTAGAATMSNKGSAAPLNASFAAAAAAARGSGESLDRTKSTATRRPFTAEASTNADVDSSSTRRLGDSLTQRRASAGDSRYVSAAASGGRDSQDSEDSEDMYLGHMRPRKDTADFDMISPPVEHLKHRTVPPTARNLPRMADILAMDQDEMMRARQGGYAGERRSSAVQILPGEVVVDMPSKEAFEEQLGNDWQWGMNVTAGSHPLDKRNARQGSHARDDAGVNTGTSSSSSVDENGVDAIGSTLNRQASLLLLLYPAAYCLLFSISIARLSVDLAEPELTVKRAHDWLHSLSRWLIFAQGGIDALIFQFVERQFRQRMKRRRRKAMGENVEESFTQRMGKKVVGHVKRSWQQHQQQQQQQQQESTSRNASVGEVQDATTATVKSQ